MKVIKIDYIDIWHLQTMLKTNVGISPYAPFGWDDLIGLKKKISYALLSLDKDKTSTIEMSVSVPECWIIDTVLNKDQYAGAENVLMQVYKAMWEEEYDLTIKSDGLDKVFHRTMLKGWEEGNDITV